MSKVIAYYTEDKEVAIIYPNINCKYSFETDDDFYNRMTESIPNQLKWSIRLINSEDIPDDYFEKAWKLGPENIVVDIRTARKVQLENIRCKRNELLKQLDTSEIEALSKNDNKQLQEIRNKKNILRNLPESLYLNELTNLNDIKQYWPEILKID